MINRLKLWFWQLRERVYWRRFKEEVWFKLAWAVPHRLVYFVMIRVWAHATTGKYGDTEAPGILMATVLKRWSVDSA